VQHTDGCSANRGRADNINPAPDEMLFPSMSSRMKQFGYSIRFRINAGEVRTFVQITVDARAREIVDLIAAAVNTRDNMFNVENGEWRVVLMNLAILATIVGPFSNRGSRRGIHPYDEPTISRACRCKTATNLFART
jgi:hypothetical protein